MKKYKLIEEIDDHHEKYLKLRMQEISEILKINIDANQEIDIMNVIIKCQREAYENGWAYF